MSDGSQARSRFALLAGLAVAACLNSFPTSTSAADGSADFARERGGENLLRNTGWQVSTGLGVINKRAPNGVDAVPALAVSGYTTGTNVVTAFTTSTLDLKKGDLVTFSAEADRDLTLHTLEVSNVVRDRSFDVRLSRGRSAAASVPSLATPVTVGDLSGVTGNGPDGWSKSVALELWIDDSPQNLIPSVNRVVGLRKTSPARQTFAFTGVGSDHVISLRGQHTTFGGWVRQIVRGGRGTYRLCINTGALVCQSSRTTKSNWQWIAVTAAVPSDASQLQYELSLDGEAGDVYFFAAPHAQLGAGMPHEWYKPISQESLVPIVKMSPISWIDATLSFPVEADSAGTYSLGFNIYPESNGTIAPDVKVLSVGIEGINENPPIVGAGHARVVAFRDRLAPPVRYGPVLPHYVANVKSFMSGEIILGPGGTAVVYSAVPGDAWRNVSMDINRIVLRP
jgi:hypothetical protein